MPQAPSAVMFPWAKARPELDGYDPIAAALELRETPIWEQTLGRVCRKADSKNARRTNKLIYASAEFELLAFIQQAAGKKTISGEDGLLDYLRHRNRTHHLERLGYDQVRDLPTIAAGRRKNQFDGLPTPARFTQHLDRLPLNEREAAWRQLYETLRAAELALVPAEELEVVYIDGSYVETIRTVPVRDRKTKEIVNLNAVTCMDGAQFPANSHHPGGKGHKLCVVWTARCMPLGFVTGKITDHDAILARGVVPEVGTLTRPIMAGHPIIPVMVGDGHLSGNDVRREFRSAGYIESTSETNSQNKAQVEKENQTLIPFADKPGWHSNGHREINCACEQATLSRIFDRRLDGTPTARVEGLCNTHGRITVTSGDYLLRSGMWVKYDPRMFDANGKPESLSTDLRLGNALTHNDWQHIEYAQKRWAYNEGAHGALSQSGMLFDGKNRFRSQQELRIAAYQLFSYLHLRGITYRLAVSASLAA